MKVNFKELFSLNGDQADREVIDQRIGDGAVVRGSNLYVLIFAILIASIGLNVNSTAVVIGAMLISPLMGVIINFAFGVASQNFIRARNSLWKLVILVIASIITSSIYFTISPLNTFSSELMARTTPTFWDVLIAFFGGFSAIIALTRKNSVSNVIPGAAIATALMPPLCTVGYCLSQAEWLRALGAMYLFSINAVFISISSIIGLYIMNIVDIKEIFRDARQRRFLLLTILIAIIPSTIMAAYSVEQDRINRSYKDFLDVEFADFDHTEIVKADISIQNKTIEVFLMGNTIDDKEIENLESKLPEYGLKNYEFNVFQTNLSGVISKDELDDVMSKGGFMDKNLLEEAKKNKKMLDLITASEELQTNVAREVLTLYPNVLSAGFSDTVNRKEETEFTMVMNVSKFMEEEDLKNMGQWLEKRFNKEVHIRQILVEE